MLLLPLFVLPTLPSLLGSGIGAATYTYRADAERREHLNSQNVVVLAASHNSTPISSHGGGAIVVADESALLPVTTPSNAKDSIVPAKDQISVYVVREGDTLSQIAEMFGVSMNTIVWANDIKEEIAPGDTLIILPVTGVRHTVKKGDTLESIAKEYHGHADEIAAFNGLSVGASLSVGTEILVPDGERTVASSKKSGKTSSSGSSTSGYFMRPLAGGQKTQGIHGYNGVDFGAPIGNAIYAAAEGTVIVSKSGGWNGGYGNYVVIKHSNGTQTLYAHTSSNIVSVGQDVVQGQVIGYVGNTGKSTGPHLHFEVRGAANPF